MTPEVLSGVPESLLLGVGLGAVASVAVATVFLVGLRLFPTEAPTGRSFSGGARRRTEIRQYLEAIDEQYAADHFVEGQEVAFYLPKRDVAITFDPRAFYRIERSPTDAVLVEHEMPGMNLGYRLPFETPEISFDDEDEAENDVAPAAAAFAVLGLPAGATDEQVKAAYREKVKEVHPDHGGDEDEFKRVREAYTAARKRAT